MSITITEYHGGRSARTRLEEGRPVLEYKRSFKATSTVTTDTIVDVRDHEDMPQIGDEHDQDANAHVIDVSIDPAKPEGDRLNWVAVVSYIISDRYYEMRYQDPTEEPPQFRFGFAQYSHELVKAYQDGDDQGEPTKPVQNSAGQTFESPPVVEHSNMLLQVDLNWRDLNPQRLLQFNNTVNSNAMTIAGIPVTAKQAFMRDLAATKKWDTNGEAYWEMSMEIEFNLENHQVKVLDTGLYQITGTGANKKLIPIKDGDDRDMAIGVNLNGIDGTPLGANEDAATIDFDAYFAKDWSGLPIPTSAN